VTADPNGCAWCGLSQRDHQAGQRWKPPIGWHDWTPPSDAQRLARMKARRKTQK
jgi:hypothetical protein